MQIFVEALLLKKSSNLFSPEDSSIKSAGLIDYNKKFMHPVSQKFLQSINIDDIDHKTQKISEELVKESKIIFCMDDKIVTEVQKRFPHHAAKV